MIGPESLDDAGVYSLDENTGLIQTVDFFTPLVDDPYVFGGIAAANALSDVYAMGGVPLSALAILCFPVGSVGLDVMRSILLGGIDKVREAGAALAGGHSVVDKEIKFGFAVTGLVHPSRILTVSGARPGDALVLTKAIGTGVLAHRLKAQGLESEISGPLMESMLRLNAVESGCVVEMGANACTDITGFGLLGHGLNVARSSEVSIVISADEVPLLPGAREAAASGMVPGGLRRNRTYVAPCLESSRDDLVLDLLCDPQTSGGLLVAVPSERVGVLIDRMKAGGVPDPVEIGAVVKRGPSLLIVE